MAPLSKDGLSFITRFLGQLPANLEYAIERNIESIEKPLLGDIDIIIHKKDFFRLVKIAEQKGILLFTAMTYGGSRVFIYESLNKVKRIDCMWKIHYKGVPLDDLGVLLCHRMLDLSTHLYVLPEALQARILWRTRTLYGEAEAYCNLLKRHGYSILNRRERFRYFLKSILRQPLASAVGWVRWVLAYLLRIFQPTGVLVSGISAEPLMKSKAINYIFQGRISKEKTIFQTIIRTRCLSHISVTSHNRLSELDLSHCTSLRSAEEALLVYLRKRSARIPFLLKLVT